MQVNLIVSRVSERLWSVAVIGLLLVLSACGKDPQKPAPPPAVPVTVAEVKQATVPIVMEFSGTVKAIRTVDIIPRVSG